MNRSINAPLMLSVSGARGMVGATMTPAVAADFAAAFGSYVKSSTGDRQPLLCVGRDSRPSGGMLAAAAMAGLASTGCRVVDLGIVATPSVAVMIGKHQASGGMEVTASHNPVEWNGLKCLNADGVSPPPFDAEEIIRRFKARDFDVVPPIQVRSIAIDDSTHQTHVERVLVNLDVEAIRAARFKVVLDSVNGAGCVPGRMLLERLGCTLVHINGEPTGHFAHTPEPIEANLRDLCAQTSAAKAACGFAQDPDADRLAIVDEHGAYIGEEYTLVLAAKRLLDMQLMDQQSGMRPPASEPDIRHSSLVARRWILAANLSTSRMIDDVAAQYPNVTVLRTAVGEAHVVAAMKPHGPAALVGGEGNGGVIFPQVCWVRDSLSAMALALSLLAAERRSLSQIVASLPRYAMIKQKFDLGKIGGLAAVKPALQRVIDRYRDQKINTLDGVRIDFADGWVHLRPSNTEPIIRLIAEARTGSRAEALIDEIAIIAGLK